MRKQSIDRYFTERMFRCQFFPALIAALILSLGDVADGLVLGNSVGYVGLAVIALTMPVAQVFNVIMNGLGIGGSVRFSQQMAQGRREAALADFQGIVCASVLVGVVIGVLGNLFMKPLLFVLGTVPEDGSLFESCMLYLRVLLFGTPMLFLNYVLNYYLKNDDLEKQASMAFTAGNITDVVLNVVLVLVLHMGVVGASLATVTGQTVGAVISLIVIARRGGALKLMPLKPDFSKVLSSFAKGFSSSVEFLYSMIFLLIINRLLISMTGGVGVAVLDVVLSVSYFMINLNDAAAKSALPVISTYFGERNEDGMRLSLRTGIRYALISGLILGALVFAFPDVVCRFFGISEPEILAEGREALRCFALSIPLAAICVMLGNYYEASQQERDTLLLTSLRGLLPIALAAGFMFLAPVHLWKLFVLTEAFSLLVFMIYKRFRRRPPFVRERVFRKTFYSNGREISGATEEIGAFCEKWELSPRQQYIAAMATEEICVATMDKGFRGKENGFIQITLIAEEDGSLELHIRDNADSFNPLAMEMNAKASEDGADLDALGIMAIKKRAKEFQYRRYQGFNTVIIRL